LIAYYNAKGYRYARIVSDTIYDHDRRSIDVDIKVEEGKRYYFRDITWSGNYVYTKEQLSSILGIEKGDIYNKDLIDKKLSFNPGGLDISSLYMDNGYLFFNITPVEVGIEGDSIDVEMRIFEGTQATINKVIVTGNDRTNDHVILRELTTLPGQKFSRSEIIRSQQRLSQLGYFDPEQISPIPRPNPVDGSVDIEWAVVEKPSDQIELSGGWGGPIGFVGTLGLVFNNFSVRNIPHIKKWRPLPVGDGQRLQLRVQANGRQFQNYTFSFTEPWLGGKKPNSFSISLNNSIQRASIPEIDPETNQAIPRRFDDFNASLKLRGVTLGLGRRLNWPDSYFSLQNSLSYLVYELENWVDRGLGFTDGNANSIVFNTTIARNNIDQPLYPSSGSTISLSVALTPPYSLWRDIDYETASNAERYKWIEYHKWLFDAKYYIKVAGKLVLESKAHLGFIGSYTNRAGVGPFERFNLGGAGLAGQNFVLGTDIIAMRGYDDNQITPPNFGQAPTDATRNLISGGIVYNKFALELRYPVTTGQAATIYGYVFAEGGNNWNDFADFNPFDLYRSAGFGARIFMPAFGLIGVNWGYGFDTLPGRAEPSGALFQFTIGQQIR
ncbi:MAG: POTRA domain-containing protein, partial [Bacteroidota bacterium]